jgi:2-phospho-L-lactate guanylyltransferase
VAGRGYPQRVSIRVIVPHRGLARAKTRLAGVLSPDERHELACGLLRHVLGCAARAVEGHGEVHVISPDAGLAALTAEVGASLEVQRGMGLNEGLEQARRQALAEGVEAIVVLHGDLPWLSPDDVRALADAADAAPSVAIAPDRAVAGTNGLALRPPGTIPFRFGRGSFVAHSEEAVAAGVTPAVVQRDGLAFDLDTPTDLARWLDEGGSLDAFRTEPAPA